MEMKYHQQNVLVDPESFLRLVWEAQAVDNGIGRLLIPDEHLKVSEVISTAFKRASIMLHSDKFKVQT